MVGDSLRAVAFGRQGADVEMEDRMSSRMLD